MPKNYHTIIPASYLTLIKDNKILLLRRFNTGFQDGCYSMIAGHVEPGETFIHCIIREAQEEAGITISKDDIKVIHTMHRKSSQDAEERIDMFFLAEKWDGEITNAEPHKCDDLSWFDLDAIPENTIPYIKEFIEYYKNNIFYSELGWD